MAPGDQLRWTKNDRANKRRNGQQFTVQQITSDGIAQIIDSEGNTQQINLSGRQYLDYAWVSTTYGSQGKTADRIMALMDSTTTNRESFYVTVSRAKHHLALYTANKVELLQWAEVSKAKENTSDYAPLIQLAEKEIGNSSASHPGAPQITEHPRTKAITKPKAQKQSVVSIKITQAKPEQQKVNSSPHASPPQPSAKQKYLALWQQYSQGFTANESVNLDLQVAIRALKAGQTQKDIALLLSAGSPMVRRIVQEQGNRQAMLYVSQTVRSVLSRQYKPSIVRSRLPQYEQQMQHQSMN